MNKPKREDYPNDVEFQLAQMAYIKWRRERLVPKSESDQDD